MEHAPPPQEKRVGKEFWCLENGTGMGKAAPINGTLSLTHAQKHHFIALYKELLGKRSNIREMLLLQGKVLWCSDSQQHHEEVLNSLIFIQWPPWW